MSSKAQSAIILKAVGRTAEANEFIASLKEHLVQTDELGAYFAFQANPYNWGMLPIPAHVEVMEALRMAGGNDALVEEMKLWLLKQKQTTSGILRLQRLMLFMHCFVKVLICWKVGETYVSR